MSDLGNIRIIGDSSINEGDYGFITILGEAESFGKVSCKSLKVMGELKAEGDFSATYMKVLGEVNIKENCESNSAIKLLGELNIDKNLKAKDFKILGEANIDGEVNYDNITLLGELNVEGDCLGNRFTSKGSANIKGILSADIIEIDPREKSKINEIGGSAIIIKKKGFFRSGGYGRVEANLIEGDNITLESTKCKMVRGKNVIILGDCTIDKIEYTESLTVDESSRVGEVQCQKN